MEITLTQIKAKIESQLREMTIDDFYFDPTMNSLKKYFCELLNISSTDEIESFLSSKFPEKKQQNSEVLIEKYNFQLLKITKDLKSTTSRIKSLRKKVDLTKDKQLEIPKQREILLLQINEFMTELQQIVPLKGKTTYDSQIKRLEKEIEMKNKQIKVFENTLLKLKLELKTIKSKIADEKKKQLEYKSELASVKNLLSKSKSVLKEVSEIKDTFYKNDFPILEFLYKVLNQEQIDESTFHKRLESMTYWRKDLNTEQYFNFISPYLRNAKLIPNQWNRVIFDQLSELIPSISRVVKYEYGMFTSQNEEEISLTPIDTSTLLAIKLASKSNSSLIMVNKNIVLNLSGGISALISFREKSRLIEKFQKRPFEIYAIFNEEHRFTLQTLYSQIGYANSEIRIETPFGYFLITEKYVIEITLNPAPILFDSNNTLKFSSPISSKARIQDEEARKEREEEEDDWD